MILGRLASLARDSWLGRALAGSSPSTIGERLGITRRTTSTQDVTSRTTQDLAANTRLTCTHDATPRTTATASTSTRTNCTLNVRLKDVAS